MTHIQSKTKGKSICESNCQRRVLTKTYGLETKIQIQLDLHLQRSIKIGTSPNVNGRGSIALLKRPTKSKFPTSNQLINYLYITKQMKLEI